MRNNLIGLMVQKSVQEAKRGTIGIAKKSYEVTTSYYAGGNDNTTTKKQEVSERTRLARSFYGY